MEVHGIEEQVFFWSGKWVGLLRKEDGVKLLLVDSVVGKVAVDLDSGSCFGLEQAVEVNRDLSCFFFVCLFCFYFS